MGDLGDGKLLDAVQMLDALIGGVIDHVGLRSCSNISLRRRGVRAALRWRLGGRVLVEGEHLVQRGFEGDEVGADKRLAGIEERAPVERQPRGERGVGVVAQAPSVGDGDEEQIQRPGFDGDNARGRRSRTRRWSSQLNWLGVRRRRCGHSNRFSTIGVSGGDVEGQLLEPARGKRDVFL